MADQRGVYCDQCGKRKRPSSPTGENLFDKAFSPKRFKVEAVETSTSVKRCILNFDGCSKGNPGRAGAGAILRPEDGSWVLRLREGVGWATNNVAEYRVLVLGLTYALDYKFTDISVRGDSKLVCMQIEGKWDIKNPKLAELCEKASELKDKFQSFKIDHVQREENTAADAQANLGVHLRNGQVETRRVTIPMP